MSDFKIVTWNINSIRLRAERVAEFLKAQNPDVLCLQEIKCREAQFPSSVFADIGYNHCHIVGQKGLHGVATLSKHPIEALETPDFCREGHARVAASRIQGFEVHNIYLPAGGDEPDPETNDKFAHKLDFVSRMEALYSNFSRETPLVVVGDLNIAPHENDVWSHKQLLKIVSHTPVETEGMAKVIKAGEFTDLARAEYGDDQKLYSWWSYRAKDWAKANKGRRLDHIWANPASASKVISGTYKVHIGERGGFKPSDHAPVEMSFGKL